MTTWYYPRNYMAPAPDLPWRWYCMLSSTSASPESMSCRLAPPKPPSCASCCAICLHRWLVFSAHAFLFDPSCHLARLFFRFVHVLNPHPPCVAGVISFSGASIREIHARCDLPLLPAGLCDWAQSNSRRRASSNSSSNSSIAATYEPV